MNRRTFGYLAGSLIASLALDEACAAAPFLSASGNGRIQARPKRDITTSATGTVRLGLASPRDAVLQMPATIPAGPLPLTVLLHGAGGLGERMLARLGSAPADAGVAVLSPDSRGGTWDGIRGDFGPDVEFLGRALAKVFDLVAVDPERLSICGFSDGATYALSLGLINGDLFRKIAAFSPGFVVDGPPSGKPGIFISHGTSDNILPIDTCSRTIVPRLRALGYAVTFREFDGGHEVPSAVATEGMTWLSK